MAGGGDGSINPFLRDVLATKGGRLVLQCYQCGTCSGSCPVLEEMTYGPRRLMHLIQSGREVEVLTSKDMWRCVSCYSCANRCPRGIEITDLMADLRRMAVERGYAQDKEAEFGLAFAETVQTHGRLFEPELLTRYYLRVLDLLSLVRMVPLGLRMLLKGKLPLLPERVDDPGEIADIDVVTSTKPKIASGLSIGKSRKRTREALLGGALFAFLASFLERWKGGA
jgi:heterodisulfide reductase subunit C